MRAPSAGFRAKTSPVAWVQKRLDEWNAKYPKEKVSLIELSSEADQQRQSLINAAQTNSAAYDVIGLDLVWVAEFAANRWIVEIPSDTKPVGVIDSVWETGSYRGKQYAVPYATDAPIMYYRKDFLEQAKVEIPKTWEDVKKATEAVRKLPGMQNIGGFGGQWAKYEGLTCNIAEFINTCGGAIVDDSGKVTSRLSGVHQRHPDSRRRLQIQTHPDRCSGVEGRGQPQWLRVWQSPLPT